MMSTLYSKWYEVQLCAYCRAVLVSGSPLELEHGKTCSIHIINCPSCGSLVTRCPAYFKEHLIRPNGLDRLNGNGILVATVRFRWTAVWYKPWTWLSMEFVFREDWLATPEAQAILSRASAMTLASSSSGSS